VAVPRDERKQLEFELWFFEGIVDRKPDYFDALSILAHDYTARGLYQQGLEADRRLAQLRPEDPTVIYNLACSLSLTAHLDEAYSVLARAIFLGYRDFRHLRRDPDLEALRSDPRFQTFFEVTRREADERKPKVS
jgi:hypothetical protein